MNANTLISDKTGESVFECLGWGICRAFDPKCIYSQCYQQGRQELGYDLVPDSKVQKNRLVVAYMLARFYPIGPVQMFNRPGTMYLINAIPESMRRELKRGVADVARFDAWVNGQCYKKPRQTFMEKMSIACSRTF